MGVIIDGRYEVTRGLGKGAMGSVYLANDPKIGREVAIKILQEQFAKVPKHQQRFEREARAIAALKHPNIVEIYDYGGSPDEHLYLVMEYVRGAHLGRLLLDYGPLPETILAACAIELCAALAHAHERGVIHRDLKPDNVFLERGRIVLADFGIVKAIAAENPLGAAAASSATEVIGTPGFMAPEQLDQKPLDARTDLFALGALLYYLAAGKLPFEADSPYTLRKLMQNVGAPPLLGLRPQLSQKLVALVHECLQVNPEARPKSAEAVRERLRQILTELGVRDARDVLSHYEANPRGYKPPPKPTRPTLETAPGAAPSALLGQTRKSSRRAFIVTAAALAVTVAAALAYLRSKPQPPIAIEVLADPAPPKPPEDAFVEVRSGQKTRIVVNGQKLGEATELAATVSPGVARFEFFADKNRRMSHALVLEPGKRITLTVDWRKRRVITEETRQK